MIVHHPLNPAIENVPAAIANVAAWDLAKRVEQGEQYADTIGSAGDVLGLDEKTARKAEVKPAQLNEAITGGLAILAHRPGGVAFAGLHWCAQPHDCPGPGEFDLPSDQIERNARGAFFTPRSLAEEVVDGALEMLTYNPGPNATRHREQWRVQSSTHIFGLKVADIAIGSGVFHLAACRYLADRLCEAWHVEAGEPIDSRTPAAMTLHARALVTERCLYGADIDPTSVELAKLSLALLAPTVEVDLSRRIVCGDSLLGITSWAQIRCMHLDAARSPVFTDGEMLFLRKATTFGGVSQLLPYALADLVVGAALKCAGKGKRAEAQAFAEAAVTGRRLVEDPERLPRVAAMTQEWLDTDLPAGDPSRRPLHWPLVFPEVFAAGAPGFVQIAERGKPIGTAQPEAA
jgi:hypothetical protein